MVVGADAVIILRSGTAHLRITEGRRFALQDV